jgi:hypothetical protein
MHTPTMLEALDRIAHELASRTIQPPAELELPWAGGQLVCRLHAVEKLACQWAELSLTGQLPPSADPTELKRRGVALAERLRYLEEPVGLLEVDHQAHEALLRSVPPLREGQVRRYYELLAGPSAVRVVRVEVGPDGVRRRIPATTTLTILSRLAGDLAAWFDTA